MESQALAGIDVVIIVTYMVGVLILGTYFGKYVKDGNDLFLAGRALPFWAIGMSIVVTDIGAMDFVAVAGGTYNHGIAQATGSEGSFDGSTVTNYRPGSMESIGGLSSLRFRYNSARHELFLAA